MVFFSGRPSDAAGPVADTITPIFTCALAMVASAMPQAASSRRVIVFFIALPQGLRTSLSLAKRGCSRCRAASRQTRLPCDDSGRIAAIPVVRESLRSQARRNVQEPAKPRAPSARRFSRQRVIGKAIQEACQRHARFETGKVESCARMDSGSECDVPIGLAPHVETIRIGKLGRISVGCADAH